MEPNIEHWTSIIIIHMCTVYSVYSIKFDHIVYSCPIEFEPNTFWSKRESLK